MKSNQKPKAIYFCNAAWNLFNFRLSLMRAMLKKGFEVIACAPASAYSKKIEAAGIRFIPVGMDTVSVNPFKEIKVIFDFYRVCRRERPTLVHNFAIKAILYGTLAARLAGVLAALNTLTGVGHAFQRKSAVYYILKTFFVLIMGGRTRLTFQNRHNMSLFLRKGLVAREKAVLIPGSGVDAVRFSPASREKTAGARGSKFCFAMISRPLWDKGIREYFEAVRLVRERNVSPNVRFVFMGGFKSDSADAEKTHHLNHNYYASRDWLEREVKRCGIEWIEYQDDVLAILREADVFVLPSYHEGLPKSVLEAMACATAVVTTKVPGCRQTVRNNFNGLLVPPKDAPSLAGAMEFFIQNPAEAARMGKRGRQMVLDRFSDEHIIRRTLREYQKLGVNVAENCLE